MNPFEKEPRNEFEANKAIGEDIKETEEEIAEQQEREDAASKVAEDLERALNENAKEDSDSEDDEKAA